MGGLGRIDGVFVWDGDGEGVFVRIGSGGKVLDGVGVSEGVDVPVDVGVSEGVGVPVDVGVSDGVDVAVDVLVWVMVGCGEGISGVIVVGLTVGVYEVGTGVYVKKGVRVAEALVVGVNDGTSVGVSDGCGFVGMLRVGEAVTIRGCTLGTKIRWPARIKVELPKQLAYWS